VPRGQRGGSLRPYSRFSRQEPLLFYQVAPQLYSRGRVDPVPDKLLFFGSAGNRTLAFTWHPISAKVGNNFADMRRSLGQYSSPADSDHGVFICTSNKYVGQVLVLLPMALQHIIGPWLLFFSFLILYTVGKTPWTGISPTKGLYTHKDNTNTE
jgi:hypothetical protein